MTSFHDIAERLRTRLPSLGESDLQELTEKVLDELQERVGLQLSEGLTDDQLAAFEELVNSGDDVAASRWLHVNRPHYQLVTSRTLEALLDETVAAVTGAAVTGAVSPEDNVVPSSPPALVEDWDELRTALLSKFRCRLNREETLSLIFDLPEDRSQLVLVSHVNDHWAEVHSAVGNALGPDQLATALTSLGSYIGVGGVLRDELLIARHGLPYRGLTVEAVERTVGLVAVAADTAEKDATGENIY